MPFMEEEKARNLKAGIAGNGRSSAGKIVLATVRATSTTSARTSSASCCNVTISKSSTSASWCRRRKSSRPQGPKRRYHRAVRPDHALARRDGFSRRRTGTPGLEVAALDRGATTSRVHTAVKIDPNYKGGPVVHVNDASRAVGVASSLMSLDRREAYAAEVRADYAKISQRISGRRRTRSG